jgi:predicted RNase H-like HicB family nuclease
MKLKVIVHEAEEGGYWAEVPSVPGCATQGETFEELLTNLYDAVEGCLSVDLEDIPTSATDRVFEIAV